MPKVLAVRGHIAACVLGLAVAACAGPRDDQAGAAFHLFDHTGDGVITQAEFTASFDVFDRNRDGVIDVTESAAIVYEADANRDGVVTREEFATIALSRLEADANRDGRITRAEFERYDRQVLAEMRRFGAAFASPGDLRPETRWVHFRF